MKPAVLAVVAAIAWEQVAVLDGDAVLVDPASIEASSPATTRAVVLFNFGKPQRFDGVPFRSAVELRHFNCAKQTWSASEFSFFEAPDALGQRVRTFSAPVFAFTAARPGSLSEAAMKRVCGK